MASAHRLDHDARLRAQRLAWLNRRLAFTRKCFRFGLRRTPILAVVVAAIVAAILYVVVSEIRNRRLANDAESLIIPT